MKQEKSCGIIPIQYRHNGIYVALIKQTNGVIGFPKGHVEPDESEEETALRECYEETNLKVEIIDGFKEEISYYMPEYDANKKVVFFIGKVNNFNIKKQDSEVDEILLADVKDAINLITFEDTKNLLVKADEFLKKKAL